MENFVIVGKAKTVFKLIELKAKREELARRAKKQNSKGKQSIRLLFPELVLKGVDFLEFIEFFLAERFA